MKNLCSSPHGHIIIVVSAEIGTKKKQLLKTDRGKQLLALDREREAIIDHKYYATVVPLAQPCQKGWKRLFVLRSEVQKSSEAEFYQQILNAINTVQYHYDESFKKPKGKRWHRYRFDELPKLNMIGTHYWQINIA